MLPEFKKQLLKTIEKHANGEQYNHISSIKDRIKNEILKQAKEGKDVISFDLPAYGETSIREVEIATWSFCEANQLNYTTIHNQDQHILHVSITPWLHCVGSRY